MSNAKTHPRSLPLLSTLQHRLAAQPLPKTEESLLLRVLSQAMVIVGIIATDVAAETQMSLWAIPLSIIGAYWSWSHRYKRNVAVKFLIALGMLLSLGAFLFGLREQLNDTRLVLAELLIQLQILHSFHMPRRQDLGYSMVIGLILIGVASTLSQTMIFGLVLLLFLAIALPVLVLDYRSRLDLVGRAYKSPFKQAGLSPRRLGAFLALILGLGLTLFMLMPRLPGYQLRTFPVSSSINQEFNNNQQIINPGYVRQGNAAGGETGRGGRATGPGEMDKSQYYGFNTQMNQNLRGELKPKVVMRVRSQAEGFWRVMAFDRYRGQGWEISRNSQTKTIKRPPWLYQFFLPTPITLNKHREVIQTYTIVSELPNVIPALSLAKELYFPTPEVAIDTEDALRSPLGLPEGLTYTVVSNVPYRDRTRLQRAPASGYKRSIQDSYLGVPDKIRGKVRRQTEALLVTSEKAIVSPYEKALFLAQALKQRYEVRLDLPFLGANEDLVEAFLFKYKGGYPDHFSTTLTIMLRSIGIPARLVTGFAPGEFNPFTGLYEVKNTDAYALTEVYFPKFGWFAFDPIPGHELIPPSIEENQTFSVLQQFWKWVAGWLPSPVANFLGQLFGGIFGWLIALLAWVVGLFQQGWVGLFTLLLLGIGLGFAGWLLWNGWRRWRYRRWLSGLSSIERLYQQMTDWMATHGLPKRLAQTPFEYVRQARETQPVDRADTIERISQAYVQWRYGGRSPNVNELKPLLRRLKQRPSKRVGLRAKS